MHYFRTIRPALSQQSLSGVFAPLHMGHSQLMNCDDVDKIDDDDDRDLSADYFDEDWDDDEKSKQERSALCLNVYRQASVQTRTDYDTFWLYGMAGINVSADVGHRNIWRQQSTATNTSLNTFHRFKQKQLRLPTATALNVASMISVLPIRESKQHQMSKTQTIFAIVNVYVNQSMLYNCYAFMKGGLAAVVIYVLLCCYLCYCGNLMMGIFGRVQARYRTFGGFAGLRYGRCAQVAISIVIVCENLGRTVIAMVTLWANIYFLLRYLHLDLTSLDTAWICLGSALCILPLVAAFIFIGDLYIGGVFAFLSSVCLCVLMAVNFVEMRLVHVPSIGNIEVQFWPSSLHDLALSVGIFIGSLSGHACLPSIYRQMQNQTQFRSALNCSWIIIFVLQVGTGVIGYLTFAQHTTFIVTRAMIEFAPNKALNAALIVLVIANLFFHIPIGVIITAELPDSMLQVRHTFMRRIFHVLWFVLVIYMAWLLRGHLVIVSCVAGTLLTLTISLLCPLAFALPSKSSTATHLNTKMMSVVIKCLFFGTMALAVCLFSVQIAFKTAQQKS